MDRSRTGLSTRSPDLQYLCFEHLAAANPVRERLQLPTYAQLCSQCYLFCRSNQSVQRHCGQVTAVARCRSIGSDSQPQHFLPSSRRSEPIIRFCKTRQGAPGYNSTKLVSVRTADRFKFKTHPSVGPCSLCTETASNIEPGVLGALNPRSYSLGVNSRSTQYPKLDTCCVRVAMTVRDDCTHADLAYRQGIAQKRCLFALQTLSRGALTWHCAGHLTQMFL